MKLKPYLDASPNCTVSGICRACKRVVIAKRIQHNSTQHAHYICPRCSSLNLRIERIEEPAEDGRIIVIFERKV